MGFLCVSKAHEVEKIGCFRWWLHEKMVHVVILGFRVVSEQGY